MKRTLATAALAALTSVFAPCARGDAVTYEVGAGRAYATLSEAVAAACAGSATEVVYDIYDAQTVAWTDYTAVAPTSASRVSFVGKADGAGIHLQTASSVAADGKGGIKSDTGTDFQFTGLTITHTKNADNYGYDYAHRLGYWYVATGGTVTYSGCRFTRGGILAASAESVFDGCTFDNQISGTYALWATHWLPSAKVTVTGCTFTGTRAVKVYAEGDAKVTEIEVTASKFSGISEKGAIDIGASKSVAIEGNVFVACVKGIVSGGGAAAAGYSTAEQMAALEAANTVAATEDDLPSDSTEDVNAVQSANLLGAVKVVSSAENVFVAAPFEAFGADGGSVKAVEAVPAAGRADGEKLYAWDGEKYNVWTASGGSWTPARKVTVAQGAGGETVVSEGVDADAAVAPGGGLILSRAASDGTAATVYIHGQVPAEGEAVVSVQASAAGSRRTLVSPVGADAAAALDLNALDWTGVAASAGRGKALTAPGDYVYFRGADGKVVQYFYLGGRWGAVRGGLFDAAGGAEVPAGTAFWYANDKGLSGAVKAVRK